MSHNHWRFLRTGLTKVCQEWFSHSVVCSCLAEHVDFSRSLPTLFSLVANCSMILLEMVLSLITDILEELFKMERSSHNESVALLTYITKTSTVFFLGSLWPFRFTFNQLEKKEMKVSVLVQILSKYSRIPVKSYSNHHGEQ